MTRAHRNPGLEWWRGGLSIYIVLHHASFWLGPNTFPVITTVMSQGRTAVIWMFVLSGWVAGSRRKPFGSTSRVKRLVWLMILGVGWGFAIEQLAGVLQLPGIVSIHPNPTIDQLLTISRLSISERLMSLFEPRWPLVSLNHPVWTLRYDLLIAVCAPWMLARHQTKTVGVLLLTAIFLPFIVFTPLFVREIVIMGGSWLLGHQMSRKRQWWIVAISVGASLLVGGIGLPIVWRDLLLAAMSLCWLYLFSHLKLSPPYQAWGRRLGQASIPLYLFHYPILLFFRLLKGEDSTPMND